MPLVATPANVEPHHLRNVLDVLIVGAGPAGLSAALALGRVLRSTVIFDSGEYRNRASAHVHTVPTHDHKNPATIRNEMIAELKAKYKTITFASTAARSIREIGAVFEVEDVTGRCWKGRKVILATGSRDILPEIPGYAVAWGKNIFNCLFCHGFEEFGVPNAAALITSDDEASVEPTVFYAHLARQFTGDMTFLTNGLPHVDHHPKIEAAKAHGFKVDNRPIKIINKAAPGSLMTVEFTDGTVVSYGFMVHKPRTVIRGPFAQQLNLEMTAGGDIAVTGPLQETSRRGVFAAGDCATYIKQIAVGMGAGVGAGAGANAQMVEEDMGL